MRCSRWPNTVPASFETAKYGQYSLRILRRYTRRERRQDKNVEITQVMQTSSRSKNIALNCVSIRKTWSNGGMILQPRCARRWQRNLARKMRSEVIVKRR